MSDAAPVFKILKVKFLVRLFPLLVVRFTKKKKQNMQFLGVIMYLPKPEYNTRSVSDKITP